MRLLYLDTIDAGYASGYDKARFAGVLGVCGTGYDFPIITTDKDFRQVATKKLKLTWDKAGARWRKIYKGKVWCGKRGVKKSDDESYRQAVEDFETWRGGIDTKTNDAKPNAKDYERAIFVRNEMIRACRLEGNAELHDRYVSDIATIRKHLAKKNPPKLGTIVLPLGDGMTMEEFVEWRGKVQCLRQLDMWQPADAEKTIGKNIKAFNLSRKNKVEAGQLQAKSFVSCAERLKVFENFVGAELSIDTFNGVQLSAYHDWLLQQVRDEKYSQATAKGYLVAVKSFVNWLYDTEVIDAVPRIMKKLNVTLETKTPKVLTIPEVKALFGAAQGRDKLYLLLMLNCAFTQIDLGELSHSEIKDGRIIRKRSKTKSKKNVPTVNYLLWKETATLLEQYAEKGGDRALLNARGNPLRDMTLKGDKLHTNDTIKKAMIVYCDNAGLPCPAPKIFRKTSASLLYNNPTHRGLHQHFLGHVASTVAEQYYVAKDKGILDEAIIWLGTQYGVK